MAIQVSAPQPCAMCHDGIAPKPTGRILFFNWEDDDVTVPLCIGCGGLSVVFDDEEFHRRVREITRLRFKICPASNLPDPPPRIQISHLEELELQVRDLYERYGHKVEEAKGSLAHEISADGILTLQNVRADYADLLQSFRNDFRDAQEDDDRLCAIGLFLAHRGREGRAERLLLEALDRFPTSVSAYHANAEFSILFRRDVARGIRCIRQCIALEPKAAEHRVVLSTYLDMIGEHDEAHIALMSARKCPDFCNDDDCPGGDKCRHRREKQEKIVN
jgi:hypothetical protein